MNKKKGIKWFGVVVFAGLAVGINYIGLQKKQQEQRQQKIEQAASNIENQKLLLQKIQEDLSTAFIDENQIFLRADLTQTQINQIKANLARIQVATSDDAIEVENLSSESADFEKEKQQLKEQLQLIVDKFTIQTKIQSLFVTEMTDWQTVDGGAAIKKELTSEEIASTRESLILLPEDEWFQNMTIYLDNAQEQFDTIVSVQANIDFMIKDGVLTPNINYYDYLELVNQVNQILNPEWQEEFNGIADEIAKQLGLY